jgi:YidC/Oxa1 family membrane protein insertase
MRAYTLIILAVLLATTAQADTPAGGAGEPLAPGAWRARYGGQGADDDAFELVTSAAHGTLESFKILKHQYYQKDRASVRGEPADHTTTGPMEMVTTWDPEFYPFQSRVVDLGAGAIVYERATELGQVGVEGSIAKGVSAPADRREGERFALRIGERVVPIKAFDEEGARLDGDAPSGGAAVLYREVPREVWSKEAPVYHLVASDERSATYIWPDPRERYSTFYVERRLTVLGPYRLGLQVLVHNFGQADLAHRLSMSTYGYQNPSAGQGSMFNPVVDRFEAVCSVSEDVTTMPLNDLVEEGELVTPDGDRVDFVGIQGRYFMAALVPKNLGPARCALGGAPFGVLQVILERASADKAPASKARCVPSWYPFAPASERCEAVRKRTGMEEDLPYLTLKKRYLEGRSALSPTERRDHELLLASLHDTLLYDFEIYLGPKDIGLMSEIGHNLTGAIDFWIVGVLAKPMLYLLRFFHGLVPHWGVAILLLTLLVKALTWWPSQKSYKQMKEMQKLKPEIDKLKAKFGSDKSRLNQETMNLYKRYNINPLGGCLPMLLQMPIWIALYRTIYSSVELYQAPLFLWIQDLSSPDPFFVLPVVMGVSMFLQQMLTPTSGMDEGQAKMMKYIMPIMFTGFMLFLPSGLVLYIFVNTLLSVIQQYWIQRSGPATAPAKA